MILINITLYLYHWVVFKLKKLNTTTKKVTKKAISKKKIKYDSYDSNEERRERRNKPLTIFFIFAFLSFRGMPSLFLEELLCVQ